MSRRLRVEFKAKAREDLDRNAAYLAEQGEGLGVRFVDAVVATARKLADHPGFGRPSPVGRGRLADTRVYRVDGFRRHLLFYKVEGSVLVVVRVVHGAQDLPALDDL